MLLHELLSGTAFAFVNMREVVYVKIDQLPTGECQVQNQETKTQFWFPGSREVVPAPVENEVRR